MKDVTAVYVIFSVLVLQGCFAYSPDDQIVKVEPRCGKSVREDNPSLHVLSDHSISVTARCENGNRDFTTADGVQYKLDATFQSGNNRCKMEKILDSNIYKVVVVVKYKTEELLLEIGQRVYTLTCTFDQYGSHVSPSHQVLNSEISAGRVEVNAGQAINQNFFTIVFTNVIGQTINGPIRLNQKIAMVASSNGANGEVGLRPVNCDAVGRLRKKKYAVLRAGCGDGVVFPKTSGFLTQGRTVRSPYFKGFHLEGDSHLSFECSFTLCSTNCDGDSCALGCGTPKTLKNTNKVYKTTTLNSIAKYQCLPGYTQTGSGLSVCQAGNVWSTPSISCKVVDCKSPRKIANGKVRYMTTTYGSVAMYACNKGYKASGSSSRSSCSANGQWTKPDIKCTAIGRRCIKPPSLPHMTAKYSSTAYGSVAVFKCIRGYTQTGRGISICASNGYWNRPLIVCKVVNCGKPTWRIANSRVKFTATIYNSMASYSCNLGYKASGKTGKSYCQASGKWTKPDLKCTIRDCKKPRLLITNSYVKFGSTKYGEKAFFVCKKGFLQTGNGMTTCQANGKWSVPKTSCIIGDCKKPPSLPNTAAKYTSTTYGSVAVFKCIPGYTQVGRGLSSCAANGFWNRPLIACRVVDCFIPTWKIANTKIRFLRTTYKSVASYTCNPGYKALGNSKSYCSANGKWTKPNLKCAASICGAPKISIPNITVKISGRTFRSTGTVSCRKGYIQKGSGRITCTFNGKWTQPAVKCTPVNCGQIPKVGHTRSLYTSTTYKSSVRYVCLPGYRGNRASNLVTCQANGKWSRLQHKCQAVNCGKIPAAANSRPLYSLTTYKSFVRYICLPGYRGNRASNLVTCRANGKWSALRYTCQAVNCGKVPVLSNTKPRYSKTTYRSRVTYSCLPGHVPDKATSSAVCQYNGRWTTPKLKCKYVNCGRPPKLKVSKAKFVVKGTTYKSSATIVCAEGYTMKGVGKISCTASGQWTQPRATCAVTNCGRVPVVANSRSSYSKTIYKSTVKYSCLPGYTASKGSSTSMCQANGRWSAPGLVCKAVNCGKIPVLSNTRPRYSKTTYRSRVIYNCLPGYRPNKATSSAVCQSNGRWTTPKLKCTIVSCGRPPVLLVPNASLTVTSTTYKSTATITCGLGFTVKGDNKITCTASGRWTRPKITCTVTNCGKVPVIANSKPTYSSTTYKSTVKYSCLPYHISNKGNSNSVCQANGKWSIPTLTCTVINCGKVPVVSNTRPRYSKTTYRSRVTYTCLPGYRPDKATNSAVCQSNGRWTTPKLKCKILSCGRPRILLAPNARMTFASTTYKSTAAITCSVGFTLKGDNKITCTASGRWTIPRISCSVTNCGRVPVVANSRPSYSKTIYKSTVKYYCLPGYTANKGSSTSVCQANGRWSAPRLICKAVDCGKVPVLSNTRPRYSKTIYKSRVIYSCLPGYRPDKATTSAVCQSNGRWSTPKLKCTIVNCRRPPVLLVPNARLTVTSTTYKSTATITCGVGFTLKGENKITCTASGRWTRPKITCTVTNCGRVPVVANSKPSYSKTIYKSTVKYSCLPGYTANKGSSTSVCQANGRWSALGVVCKAVNCGKVPVLSNTRPRYSKTIYKSRVIYSCLPGYRPDKATNSAVCQSNGRWTTPKLKCTIKNCGTPKAQLANGKLIFTSTLFGSTATVTCNKGYRPRGPGKIKCAANGRWTKLTSICAPVNCGKVPAIANTKSTFKTTIYKSTARYSCLSGYKANTAGNSITCQASGKWTTSSFSCKPVDCGSTSKITIGNGTVVSTKTTFGSTATVTCKKGYLVKGNNKITCAANAKWTTPTATCNIVYCGKVPVIANSKATYNDTFYKCPAIYSCLTGYRSNKEKNTIVCQADGTWTKTKFVCKAVDCGKIPVLSNTRPRYSKTTYKSRVIYSCLPGYRPNKATNSAVCQSNGRWTTPKLKCTIRNCGTPKNTVGNSKVRFRMTTFRSTATVTCNKGYIQKGSGKIRCAANGRWTKPVITCSPVNCGKVPAIANSKPSYKTTVFKSTVTYSCQPGHYSNKAKNSAVCQDNGKWSPVPFKCSPVNCGSTSKMTIGNGTIVSTKTTFGSTATVTCKKGYLVSGNSKITCAANAKWTTPTATCKLVYCGKVPVIANSKATYNDTFYKCPAIYSCLTGYRSNKENNTIVCQADGTWTKTKFVCNAVDCGKVPVLSNTSPRYSKTTYKSRVIYSCLPGYLPDKATTSAVCHSNGRWTTPKLKCTIRNCGTPKTTVGNSKVIFRMTTFRSTATVTCNKGYIQKGSGKIRCTANGRWTKPVITCSPVNCGKVPAVANGIPSYKTTIFKSKVTYSCPRGYYSNKARNSATCQDNGKWSTIPFRCSPVDCGSTSKITIGNGTVVSTKTTFGSTATVTCKKGYLVKGNSKITCAANAKWTTPTATCNIVYCGKVPVIANSKATYNDTFYKCPAIYSCLTGYRSNKESNTIVCQADGTWTKTKFVCKAVDCGKIVPVPNSNPVYKLTIYKSKVSYTCKHGFMYSMTSDKSICQATGIWTKPKLKCTGSVCGVPPKIEFSNLKIKSTKLLGTGEYTCLKGYKTVKGSGNIRCLATKKWTTASLVCKIHDCKTPKFKVPNALLKVNGTTYKSAAKYSCPTGYIQTGPGTTICQADGKWSQPVITCKIINCGKVPVVKNSNPSYKSTVYKSTVKYSCLSGHISNKGTSSAVCQLNGKWTLPKLVCTVVNCGKGKIPAIANSKPTYKNTVYKSSVKYACLTGYFANNGSNSVICQANGKWSSTTLRCTLHDCKVPTKLPNMKVKVTKTTYGSTARYYCNYGYKTDGSGLTKCGANGKWQTPKLKCTLSTCGIPLKVTDADLMFKTLGLAEFTCKTGFKTVKGNGTIRCLKDKKWTKSDLVCNVVDCGKIPIVSNSKATYKSTIYKSKVIYMCKFGYKVNNKALNKAVCQASGKWSLPKIACEASACGIPPTIRFTELTIKSTNTNGLAQYTCIKGYEVTSGSGTIKCQSSKKWTVSTVKCKIVDCGKKWNLANAKIIAVLTTYQAKATFVCLPGYYSNKGNGETVCQANKSWKKSKLTCQAPACGPAPTKEFSTVAVNSPAINGLATYKCIKNFEGKRGSNTIKCLSSKKWSVTNFRCEIIKCDPPKFFVPFAKLTRNGKTAKYTCSKGFYRIGNGTTTCLYNGTWTDPRVRCKAVNCGNPKTVPNMKAKYILTKYLYNATYTCDIGYKSTGSGLVTCQKDGKWSKLTLKCGIIDCGQPKFKISNSILKVKGTVYRSGGSYTCKQGFFSYGHGEIACRSDGYWTKPSIICKEIDCGKPASLIDRLQLIKYNKTYYAATALYGCKPGYKIIPGSYPLVQCLKTGKWSSPQLKCKEVLCPAPPAIKHATVKISNSRPKGVASYLCLAGYEAVGKITNAVCQISGVWTKPTGSCREIDCGKVPVVANAKPTYTKTSYKSIVKYSCSFGFYSKKKIVVSVCQANKTWSIPDIKCSKSTCGIPAAHPNVDIIHDKKNNTRAMYKCSKGFKQIGGNNSIICQANGTWTKAKPICTVINCGKSPPPPANSSVDKQPKNSLLQSVVDYKCTRPLTKISGSYSSTCMEDGKWSKPTLVCGPDPNYCKNAVPTFPNSRPLVKSRTYGAKVSYSCDIGYRIIGMRFSQCLITGKWSDPKSKCLVVNCGVPRKLRNAKVEYKTTLLRSVAHYRCNPGFKASGITKVVCTASGRWTAPSPCIYSKVVDCGKPPELPLLKAFVMGKTTIGSRAFYRCVTGYRPNPGTSGITVCLRTGFWSKPSVECKAIGK